MVNGVLSDVPLVGTAVIRFPGTRGEQLEKATPWNLVGVSHSFWADDWQMGSRGSPHECPKKFRWVRVVGSLSWLLDPVEPAVM